nr:DUF2232 domain-containing protein [Desulfobulbaceae bacterium]
MNFNGQYLKSVLATTAIFALPTISGGVALLYFLTPLPLVFLPIYLGFEKGFKIILHSILLSGVIALAFGSLSVLFFSLTLLPVGFVLARSINRKESLQLSALYGALALATIWFLTWLLLSASSQSNIYVDVLKSIDTSLEEAYTVYRQSSEISADIKVELQAIFTRVRELIPVIFPGILAVIVFGTVFINMTLANGLLTSRNCPSWPSFRHFKLPDHFVWPVILGGVLLFTSTGWLKAAGLNLLLVFGSLFFIQGLSVLITFFSKWSVPKLVRILILFFLIIQAYGFLLLALLGIAEIWANFRKPVDEINNK